MTRAFRMNGDADVLANKLTWYVHDMDCAAPTDITVSTVEYQMY